MALLTPLSETREQMERMFTDLIDDFGFPSTLRSGLKPFRLLENASTRAWLPAIEMLETEKDYVVKAEVPGMKPEDIHVEVLGNTVTIQGETEEKKEEEKRNTYRSEFRYGRFIRQIQLPTYVKGENTQAEYKNGILELKIPKMEESKRNRITVNVKK